jgi:hypothetical protein
MKPSHPLPATDVATLSSLASPASVRLNQNRERLARWARPSLMGWVASAAWPLIKGLREHPSASLAAGALFQRLLRPAPATVVMPAPMATPTVLVQGLGLVRRHPRTVVALAAVAGAVWLWRRSTTRPPQR